MIASLAITILNCANKQNKVKQVANCFKSTIFAVAETTTTCGKGFEGWL